MPDFDPLFLQAIEETDRELRQTGPNGQFAADAGLVWNSATGTYDMPEVAPEDTGAATENATGGAVLTGAAKAGFEASDFVHELSGTPIAPEDRSQFRQDIETTSEGFRATTPAAGVIEGISQFVTGLLGVGKLVAPLNAVQKLKAAGTAGRATYETARGAAAGAIFLDPHEERLSNLIQSSPALQNPISEYLAAGPEDSAAEGRLKNALEGAGMDLAVTGAFALSLRAMRYLKSGDRDAAAETIEALERAEASGEARPAAISETPTAAGADSASLKADPPASAEGENSMTAPASGEGDAAPAQAWTSDGFPLEEWEIPQGTALGTKVSEADTATIIQAAKADLDAIRFFDSREEAIANGYKFSTGNLPWQKLAAGPDEARALIDNTAAVLKPRLDDIKGGDVLADADLRRMVEDRAALFNEDPSETIGELIRAGDGAKSLAANMEASYLLANRALAETYDVAAKIRNGMLADWEGDAARAAEELRNRLSVSADLLGAAQSIRSNVGRTMRRMRSEFQIQPEDLAALKTMDAAKLAELVYASKGEPAKLASLAKPGILRRVIEEGRFSLTNSLLWLWPTHAVNLTTNAYMLAARPTEKALGSLLLGAAGSPVRRQAVKEYGSTVAALHDGWEALRDAFLKGDSILSPHASEAFSQGHVGQHPALNFKPMKSLDGILHNAMLIANYRTIVGFPTRALGAVDELMKTLRYRAVVQAKAATEAGDKGLSGADLKQYIERRLAASFDDAGQATDAAALREAQTATFQQDLLPGTIGATLQNARATHPTLGLVLPFIKTPINVLRYAHKYTPGINLLQKEYRQMIMGGAGKEAQAQAMGQMMLGTVFTGIAANLAANGRISGGGPRDPALLSALRATGWQPYSIVWEGEDGNKHYFPLGRFDPVGLPMSIIADLVEAQKVNPEDRNLGDAMTASLLAVSKNFSDRGFLLNINQLLRAASDPERHLGKYLGQTAAGAIPLSSLLKGTNPDPYMREARSFVDQLKKDLPGYSETLPPRRDAFGEPIWRRVGLMTTEEADEVEAEHSRILLETGKGFSLPNPNHGGVDLRDFTLSDGKNAYDLYQQLAAEPERGPTLKAALAKAIRSETYSILPDGDADVKGTRINTLAGIVQQYRQAAYKSLLRTYPELRKETTRRSATTAAQIKANRSGEPDNAKKLLDALGY
ncbi:hypothetical protein J2Y48_000474 [Mycoplana sp. BE70]|uniref:hypothetical protein n=1 Tax=Mycoplana sp. BE70 TaxID=2817775 RepID=UPI00285B0623|nr:hypothetical protein [Mycoplana sp. BE70]MDR6755201.1 hypothetical protein [Mycoplana sp. BE70]